MLVTHWVIVHGKCDHFVYIVQISKSFCRKKAELSEKANLLKGRFNLT